MDPQLLHRSARPIGSPPPNGAALAASLTTPAATPAPRGREHRGWHASLSLGFCRGAGRTVLDRRQRFGPLQVQRPFYPEGEVCHLYLLHPPGGVVGGDVLEVGAALDPGAHALITTPAAAKFYRSAGAHARQVQELRVAGGAILEWMPQETIVFDGACARSETRIHLAEGARCIAWEILCLGRPAAGAPFSAGLFEQRLEIYRERRPVLVERARYQGGDDLLSADWGLGGRPVTATMACSDCDPDDLAAARGAMQDLARGELMSATLLDGLLLVRYLGVRAECAKERFVRVWSVVRPRRLGRPACEPRIWRT